MDYKYIKVEDKPVKNLDSSDLLGSGSIKLKNISDVVLKDIEIELSKSGSLKLKNDKNWIF